MLFLGRELWGGCRVAAVLGGALEATFLGLTPEESCVLKDFGWSLG